jgi:Mlc titration factor MtfA (ptsG expression regulator)
MWKDRKKLLSAPFPPDWQRLVRAGCSFYERLPEPDRRELEGRSHVFLAEKKFEGCDGLRITDEIRVCIAAQACLLLLHRRTDGYPGLRTILVYPSSYYVRTTRPVGAGVLEEGWQARAGESWQAGAVVLAWDEVRRGGLDPEPGNVVLHEFAHQLDCEDGGAADGIPALGNGESFRLRQGRHAVWVGVMRSEYEQLRARVQNGETSFLRAYGATNPAEFFAVATESFFGQPLEMQRRHPALYEELKWFYRQDPAQWPPAMPSS